MIDPIFMDAIIFSSLLTLLSMGLTLTYQTTKVPNFAHGTFAAVGAYVALTVSMVWKVDIYQSLYLAFIVGGLVILAQYSVVLRPLLRKGTSIVGLMITTLAIDLILLAFLNIYADYLERSFKIISRDFYLRGLDITILGQRGLLIIAPTLAAATVTLLYFVLTRTKFGVSMRAAIENPSLAGVMGINVNRVYAVSWFIAGGLAGLSGALLPLLFQSNPDIGVSLIASIFAGSIVGGLFNIYGAVLGGYLIGLAEILGTYYLASNVGTWIIPYRPLIPLIAIAVTLLLTPKGLLGVDWARTIIKLQKLVAVLNSKLKKIRNKVM
jgi:branched-chain amino acid transport system permease protein